ncbi:unnamed protein product [Auanema sp. JU1783]|nr:unnamed protein product [Auanema sp. JU1783]
MSTTLFESLSISSCLTIRSILVLLLLSVADAYSLCNQNTKYECECTTLCWDIVASGDTIDWLSISISECPPQFNETTFRRKISAWINEECNSALTCNLNHLLTENEILIGEYSCQTELKEIRILALRNASNPIEHNNVIPSNLIGQVIQSREHLLSFLLHADLQAVTLHRRFRVSSEVQKESLRWSMVVLSIIFAVFLFIIGSIVYFSQIYINWKRIVKGKWQCKEYRKVPNVRYSVDEIETGGHI